MAAVALEAELRIGGNSRVEINWEEEVVLQRSKSLQPTGDQAIIDALRDSFAPVCRTIRHALATAGTSVETSGPHQVSKFEHCLNDLLFRARIGELPIDIVGVVSNHPDHRRTVEWHGIPFFHVPVTADSKAAAEEHLLELIERLEVELVVRARYMQVLSDELTRRLDGRAINIHHSFLPSFKGAKPYHQAQARGVKTVGARPPTMSTRSSMRVRSSPSRWWRWTTPTPPRTSSPPDGTPSARHCPTPSAGTARDASSSRATGLLCCAKSGNEARILTISVRASNQRPGLPVPPSEDPSRSQRGLWRRGVSKSSVDCRF